MSTMAIAFNASSRLEVFALGADGSLWHAWELEAGGATWSPWYSLGGGPANQIVVAADGNQLLSVFALVGGTVQWISQASGTATGWNTWAPIGAQALSRLVVGTNTSGILELFGVGADDGALWHSYQDGANASTWSTWESLGGGVDGTTALVDLAVVTTQGVSGAGGLAVFALDDGAALQVLIRSGTTVWGAWASLGGLGSLTTATLAAVTAAVNSDGRLEAFGLDTDGASWHLFQESGPLHPWSPWESLAGSGLAGLSASMNRDGVLEVFAVATGGLVHNYQDAAASSGWHGWTSLGSPVDVALTQVAPTPVPDGAGHLTVFAIGDQASTALATARITQASSSTGWSEWVGMGSLEGPFIDHVVVLMLENRGFDSVLGYLYDESAALHVVPAGGPGFAGLIGFSAPEQEAHVDGKLIGGRPRPAVEGPNSPGRDPGETFEHVNVQLFGRADPPANSAPTMDGFLKDYCEELGRGADERLCSLILDMFTPADLPVLSSLARTYAVSDAWFSSVPTQTNANRAFSLCGTSLGAVNNGCFPLNVLNDIFEVDSFDTPTVWSSLDASGVSWGVYFNDYYPPVGTPYLYPYTWLAFPQLQALPDAYTKFKQMPQFFEDASAGTLPAFTYIEPGWGGEILKRHRYVDGNDYHPPIDVGHSERMLRLIYEALRANPHAWQRTLLVIVFDEHGGTYDHVAPPATTPPWGDDPDPVLPIPRQFGFNFDRLGVRVPCILASPWIEAQTVVRSNTDVPFDHTSIPASLLDWQGIDRESVLGARVAAAPSFWHVLNRKSPRVDDQAFPPARGPASGTPLTYGQPFWLRWNDDLLLGVPDFQASNLYAQISTIAAPHELRGGYGPVNVGSFVMLRTNLRELQGPASGVRPRNILGAWSKTGQLYYDSANVLEPQQPQRFRVQSPDRPLGEQLAYGDRVQLLSTRSDATGWVVDADGARLKLSRNADAFWTIEPLPDPPAPEPDVLAALRGEVPRRRP